MNPVCHRKSSASFLQVVGRLNWCLIGSVTSKQVTAQIKPLVIIHGAHKGNIRIFDLYNWGLFIPQICEHLLCAGYYSKCQWYSSEYDRQGPSSLELIF